MGQRIGGGWSPGAQVLGPLVRSRTMGAFTVGTGRVGSADRSVRHVGISMAWVSCQFNPVNCPVRDGLNQQKRSALVDDLPSPLYEELGPSELDGGWI